MRFFYKYSRRIGFLILLLFVTCSLHAQKKIVFEDLRIQTFNEPLLHYVKDPAIQGKLLQLFSQVLSEFQYGTLIEQQGIPTIFVTENKALERAAYQFSNPDSLLLHLQVDFFEASPEKYFALPQNSQLDSMIAKRVKSIFFLDISILDAKKTVVKKESLQILLTQAPNLGYGYLYNNGIRYGTLAITPKAFVELIKASIQILFNPKNELAVVEIGVSPAYFVSNCYPNQPAGKVKVDVIQQKGIWNYSFASQQELFKAGEPLYQDLLWKGNQINAYPESMQGALKAEAKNANAKFVFLSQTGRDIVNDKNYQLQLVSQVVSVESSNAISKVLKFLSTNHHYLFHEKDTLARFSIKSQVLGNCSVDLNKIHNGVDTIVYHIPNVQEGKASFPINYTYQIEGVYAGKNFQIKLSGANGSYKEFFINQQLFLISKGKSYPEELLFFNASLPTEIINGLLFIGFNPFLE